MTEEQIEFYRKASESGSLPDDKNPLHLFSTTHSDLLIGILKRDFSVFDLVRYELKARGLDTNGKYIGFKSIVERKQPEQPVHRRVSKKGKGL